ncbi:MAG: arabinan endo-1,5-alpha-L-arabinosidase [Verrucomicrobiota bacterium]
MKTRWPGLWASVVLIVSATKATAADPRVESLAVRGQTFIHDPSSIIKDGDRYFVFGTRRGIAVRSSPDLLTWTNEPSVFFRLPEWTTHVAPGFDGFFWAPDVIRLNGRFFLYYSVSAWGKQTSAIGLATNPTLDSAATNYLWQDCGPVIQSTNGSPFNTIDPSVMLDADGRLWMAFGSYWKGIYLVELDAATGRRANTNEPVRLAWNEKIEAACLTRHENFYYLFVNWGQCCRGTNSTYEVRIGRAGKVTGPYLDREGRNLVEGGGSPFLESTGRFIGPGHIGILNQGGTNWFGYHYYDGETFGRSRLGLGQIQWRDGWPEAKRMK